MGTLEKFWTQFGILVLKRVSKFVIPEFRDTLLVPKITKCGDLLYFIVFLSSSQTFGWFFSAGPWCAPKFKLSLHLPEFDIAHSQPFYILGTLQASTVWPRPITNIEIPSLSEIYKTWFSISSSTLYVCLAMLWVKTLAANNIQTCCQLMYWMKLELEFSDFLSHTCRWLFCSFLYFLFMLRTIILDSSKYQLHI